MDYIQVLKEQSVYIEESIANLIVELNTVGDDNKCDSTILQDYSDKLEVLNAEMKTLIEATRMNILREENLQKKRKAVIGTVSEYINELERVTEIIPVNEELILNASMQDVSFKLNNSKNRSVVSEQSDDEDNITNLLNKPLPNLLPL